MALATPRSDVDHFIRLDQYYDKVCVKNKLQLINLVVLSPYERITRRARNNFLKETL
jgi:hypothetical protein